MGRRPSYGMATDETLHQMMEADEKVSILDEDTAKMGRDFGVTKGIWEKWSNRIKNTALSESAIPGSSCGTVVHGLKSVPKVVFTDFLRICFDQLTNNATKLNFMCQGRARCGITVCTIQDGEIRCAYYHSARMESRFMNTSGLVVICPITPYRAKGMLTPAIKSDNSVSLLECKTFYNVKGEMPQGAYEIPLYETEVEREGSDVIIVAAQIMLGEAYKAVDIMAKEGVSVEITDPRTIYLYDKDTVQKSVAKIDRVILAQEGPKYGGWGAKLSVMISEDMLGYSYVPIERVTSLDSPVPYTPMPKGHVLPQLDDLVETCRKSMEY